MRIVCLWHKRYFPNESVPYLIAGGIATHGRLHAICEKCWKMVSDEIKKEQSDEKPSA